jgi:hypothetical protein
MRLGALQSHRQAQVLAKALNDEIDLIVSQNLSVCARAALFQRGVGDMDRVEGLFAVMVVVGAIGFAATLAWMLAS